MFVAGQVGRNTETGEMADGFAAPNGASLANLATVLTGGGAQPEHVAHMTWYVTDIDATRPQDATSELPTKKRLENIFQR